MRIELMYTDLQSVCSAGKELEIVAVLYEIITMQSIAFKSA
ncbi:hypothetical protein PAM7971_03580 [Pacificibacter marinus]|uniref:Uncharacterized protein n=1 Tax=Pacificibacter marinus TaxID=658057 RepID=A0A1Y5TQV1_9RHOB|nr:hypothetical protein PAM7971_03580 [Pacificibacter marinus]